MTDNQVPSPASALRAEVEKVLAEATPGPWKHVVGANHASEIGTAAGSIISDDGDYIAKIEHDGDRPVADAALIAAAPSLLRRCADRLREMEGDVSGPWAVCGITMPDVTTQIMWWDCFLIGDHKRDGTYYRFPTEQQAVACAAALNRVASTPAAAGGAG